MIFGGFCKTSIFIEKREKQKKRKKVLYGFGLAHNEAGSTARIQFRSKKKPSKRGLLGSEYFA